MGENFLSVIVTILFFILMAYLIYIGRQKRALNRSRKSASPISGSNGRPGDSDAKAAMADIKSHLVQLQSLASAQGEKIHEPQAHVVAILAAVHTQLTDLDHRIKVFEREAEAFTKSHVGLQNP